MRKVHGRQITAFRAGLIGILLILGLAYLGFTKDIPFTRPFELRAVFTNAPPIQTNSAVRIAGVEVGKVAKVEPLGGDSPGVRVTMKLKDEALPIHRDAQVELRERIFLEGNVFINIKPGTPDSPDLGDGDTIPVTQTSAPVQLDQVLGTLQTNTRKDLQDLLIGYGEALNGQPAPGEDADQDPDTKGETGGQALNDSLQYSTQALRGSAIVNQATLGTDLHDISKLIAGQQKVTAALSSREGSLKDLISNWNITTSALAAQESDLSATVRELPKVLEAARPALDNLNAAFPATRAWALEMLPGVRETPATLKAGFPWVRQTRALLRPNELQGLVADLHPAVDDFAKFVNGQIELLPVFDLFNRCQSDVVLPSGETVIADGALSTGLKNYQEFLQALQGFVGAGQNFTGNGIYTRYQPGGGAYPVQTGAVGHGTGAPQARYGNATSPPLGTRPARGPKAAYKPNAQCYKQGVPDLNSAQIGGGP
ncbi:MAG: phospholipid/cholesterol/gamma-HCH transport system substrate-binding protein [Thermoleophilaceae bacterium]|nr:phospholipid/cholesterol/gamma-HCH transport system substrate-binding protein [Thermoleophilaceae bacterium]